MSTGCPARCTTTTATVRSVSTAATVSAVTHPVVRSTSAITGRAPQATTALAVAMNVAAGTTTSAPASTPSARKASSRATVPFDTTTACVVPAARANSDSKARPCSPVQ
jgi:hypothetical protein